MSDLQHHVDILHNLSHSNSVAIQTGPLVSTDESRLEKDIVILQPITIRIPNRQGIYSPSKLRPKITMNYERFLSRYADYPRKIRVCLDENPASATLFQRSVLVTAYGFGRDGWYIVVSDAAGESVSAQ